MEIILYSTSNCPRCEQIKKQFNELNIDFLVNQDIEEMKDLGIRSVPVAKISGELCDYNEILKRIKAGELTQIENQIDGRQLMSDAKYYEGYSRYMEDVDLGRYEMWHESVRRVMNMHKKYYKDILKDNRELLELFEEVRDGYEKKLFLGAQRALQFGGEQLLKKHSRLYNCSASYCDRPNFFGGLFFMLLSGAGVGFSVQKHHINKLPTIEKRNKSAKTFVIPDSIEGWSQSVDVLLSSYFSEDCVYPEYQGRKIYFDLSKIRPKGAEISGGFKAPGAEPLRKCLDLIENLIERELSKNRNKLRPIVAYDICMHIADSVLSGGVRRSACICIFSKDDEEMLKAKTGDWFIDNPQRSRSNNSVMLVRDKTTFEEFQEIIKSVKDYGEPAFIWSDDSEFVYNPCFTGDMKLLTEDGYKTFKELCNKEVNIINKDGNISNGKVWCSGEKEVVSVKTKGKTINCTEDHVFMTNDGMEYQAKDLKGKRLMPYLGRANGSNGLFVKLGFIQGDGCLSRINSSTHKGLEINIGYRDEEVFSLFNIEKQNDKRAYYITDYNEILEKYGFDGNVLPKRVFPKSYDEWTTLEKLDFLKGCYSANGCVIKGHRISYKTTCDKFAVELMKALSEVGIGAYVTTNKPKSVKFDNGEYLCKQSYDINISKFDDFIKFYNNIGFVQEYKTQNLKELIMLKSPYVTSVKKIGVEKVYDFSEPLTNWGVVEGVIAHNCVEVGFKPVHDKTSESGFSLCNLTEINGALSKTKEIFLHQCKLASIMGTLQAGYTKFDFMKDATVEIVEREALIGVGITGMMNNPDILFNPEIQREGARVVKYWNKKVSEMIGIKQAARTTVIKPSGNSSVILQSASGVHGEHSPVYLRHVQFNKETDVAKLFMSKNPNMCEESVWNREKDIVVAFPIKSPERSIYKKDLLGTKQLEYVKLTQQNWIEEGTNVELCNDPRLRMNVSNTITVDDWDEVAKYIYENRSYLCGVSLLSASGDKAYPQAPFTEVVSHEDIINKYGEIALFTSALIEAGLNAFDNDLWMACTIALSNGKGLTEGSSDLLKRDFVRRFNKFANNFKSKEECATCLKEIHVLHKYWKITNTIKDIDWVSCLGKKEFVDIDTIGAVACHGGNCEI